MKKIFFNAGVFAIYFLLASVMLSSTAHAYIDPAATSYIVQIIAGIVIACSVTIGVFWKKIRLFFKNLKIKTLEKSLSKKAKKK